MSSRYQGRLASWRSVPTTNHNKELMVATRKKKEPEKLMDEPTKAEVEFVKMNDYLDYVSARMKYLDAKVEALKDENDQYKATIRRMERRIQNG